MVKIPRSEAHRLARRRKPCRYWMEPIISPYEERLARAAMDGHTCQMVEVTSHGDLARGQRVYLDERGTQHTEPIERSPDPGVPPIKVVAYKALLSTGECEHCGQPVLFNLAVGHVEHETPNEACDNPWPAA